MKIAIILGTRPEIIKFSPIIKYLIKTKHKFFVIHTGQHHSKNMTNIFFEELRIPQPNYNLKIGSGTHAEQVGRAMIEIEKILFMKKPEIVLVQGDTNSSLAGALTASKLNIPVGHVEAGLRSWDETMPEEKNRIVIDHISKFLFTPTKVSYENLIKESIDKGKIFVTGNTISDVVKENIQKAKSHKDILQRLNLTSKKYILVTLHRQENVDSKRNLANLCLALKMVNEKLGYTVLWPIHPRTAKKLMEYKINTSNGIIKINPVGFFEFLFLEMNAALIITDSGGVQEEACILNVPCITVRDNTERPETITVGSNVLAGSNPRKKLLILAQSALKSRKTWENPFGEGASKNIVDIIDNKVN